MLFKCILKDGPHLCINRSRSTIPYRDSFDLGTLKILLIVLIRFNDHHEDAQLINTCLLLGHSCMGF